MFKTKKLLACIISMLMISCAFTACGGDDSSSDSAAETTAATTAAETTAEETTAEETSAEETTKAEETSAEENSEDADSGEDSEFAVAKPGDAYLAFADEEWIAQYWGTDVAEESTLRSNAKIVTIDGDGQYTVSLDGTTADYYEITGFENMTGLSFAAVIVKDGTKLYPDMTITIDSVKVDDKELEIGKSYTASDDGVEMRANIYNSWVKELPEDARTADGDTTGASACIVDAADFSIYETIEVTFTISGVGEGGGNADAKADGADGADADSAEGDEKNADAEVSETDAEADETKAADADETDAKADETKAE